MAQASNRPLSPHLQIWRWGPAMLVSILHRATGDGLAVAGLGLLLWWLGALASGPEAYATFTHWVWAADPGNALQVAANVLGKIVLIGLSWAFFQHLASGLRHFVLDIGAGYELNANARWSIMTIVASALATIAFWAFVLLR
ncbi:MAG: succinate dehydrogenase, cytochrome b556 subunit [Sphingomonadales bacterium]|nr:succinate dehydrogenase, cytochrome b556 subunit [Sphingomonadales bacterium]MDE2568630.1 succinate dehydrogenase, cytochrome b556 subunit [Sphingomonadales bacterium]